DDALERLAVHRLVVEAELFRNDLVEEDAADCRLNEAIVGAVVTHLDPGLEVEDVQVASEDCFLEAAVNAFRVAMVSSAGPVLAPGAFALLGHVEAAEDDVEARGD